MKTKPTFDIEKELYHLGYENVIGVDECGRGPGAGPVVAAAVRIPLDVMHDLIDIVNDSKKLSEKKRKEKGQCLLSALWMAKMTRPRKSRLSSGRAKQRTPGAANR